MRNLLIVDTSVWIDAVSDQGFLRRVRAAKYPIAIADEAVHELVAGVVSAAKHMDEEAFLERRRACALAAAYASSPLSPIGIHLARLVGFQTRSSWDVRSLLHDVARTRNVGEFNRLLDEQSKRGSSFRDFPESRDSRRRRWVESIRGAFASAAPHLLAQDRPTIPDEEFQRLRRPDIVGDGAIVRIEVEELKGSVLDLGVVVKIPDDRLAELLRPHLAVYLQVFRAAYLDLYTGSHNATSRRVKFERNDWNDLAQLRYVQGPSRWVTSEFLWPEIAKRTDFPESIAQPSDIEL